MSHHCEPRAEELLRRLARAVYDRLQQQIEGKRPPVGVSEPEDLDLLDALREAAAGDLREYHITAAGEIRPR